jgi:FKBP-type peptidyl-prolyl cis-trans isomerase FklB
MKKAILAGTLVAAAFASSAQVRKTTTAPKPLKNGIDSLSYAIGLNVASNMKQQGIDNISPAAFTLAMQDVFKNKKTIMDMAQANTTIQEKLQAYMAKKGSATKAAGDAYRKAEAKKPGMNVLPNGLMYQVLKSSDSTVKTTPTERDQVSVHYIGTFIDGKEFDNSVKRGQPATFGVTGVIAGWTQILQKMAVGDKWRVIIPSDLGYGDRDYNGIPAGSTLIFEMELLGVIKPDANAPQQ